MLLPEDFWAFNFQLPNYHYFQRQKKTISACHDNDVTAMQC